MVDLPFFCIEFYLGNCTSHARITDTTRASYNDALDLASYIQLDAASRIFLEPFVLNLTLFVTFLLVALTRLPHLRLFGQNRPIQWRSTGVGL